MPDIQELLTFFSQPPVTGQPPVTEQDRIL